MIPKVLFYGIPSASTETLISVPSGKVYVVSKIYITNTDDDVASLTLAHKIDSTNSMKLLQSFEVETRLEIGPMVIEEEQELLYSQGLQGAIHIIGYGYEQDIDIDM